MVSEVNIFDAVKKLCECVLPQRQTGEELSSLNLNKIAMECYEILLRNPQTSSTDVDPPVSAVDLLWKENFLHAFDLRDKCAVSDDSTFESYEQLQSIIEELQDNSHPDSQILQDAITFLVAVKNYDEEKTDKDKELCPGLDMTVFQKGREDKVLHDAIFGNFRKSKRSPKEKKMFSRLLYVGSPIERPEKHSRKAIEEAPRVEKIVPTRYGWDWDSLGEQYVSVVPKFITSTTELHQFVKLHKQETHELYSPICASTEQLLRCLKCLAVGMPSELFYIDETIQFRMERQVTIDSLLPGTSVNIIKEFLECGSCYCRFQTLISNSNDRKSTFKALCGALENYLTSFRLHVFMNEIEGILTFYSRIRKEMHQFIELARILAVHPETDISMLPLSGSKLLGYLHTEIMQCVDVYMTSLLLYIFKCCCSVYFKCLQDWVFKGILDDPSSELFIHFLDIYRPKTKYFFDRAYSLRKALIPEFILGLEDVILQCGKYVQLLKEFQPLHPLIRLDSPRFTVCLFHDEIIELRTNCETYLEKVRQSCGEPMSFRQLFEQRAIEQENLRFTAAQGRKKNIADYEERKEAMAKARAAEKAKKFQQCKELVEQMTEQKRIRTLEELDRELKYLNQAKVEETKYLMKENARLEASVELYDELNNILDSQRQKLLRIVENGPVSDTSPAISSASKTDNTNNNVEKSDTENNNDDVSGSLMSTKTSQKNIKDVRNRNSKFSTTLLQDKDKFASLDNLTNIQADSEVQIGQSELGVHFCSLDSNQNASSKIESKSDLEINRAKMMYGDTFAELNKAPNPRKLYLDWNTERAKNRQKVMETEFHLTYTPLAAVSPMSTTSDFSTTSEEKCSYPTKSSSDVTYPDKNAPCHSQKITQYLRSENEREKNRRKVLVSEFNIHQDMGMKKSKTFELSDLGRNLFELGEQFHTNGSIDEISEPDLQQGNEAQEEVTTGNIDENASSKSIKKAPDFFCDWKESEEKKEEKDALGKVESNECTPSSDVGLPMDEQLRVDLEAARQFMGERSSPSTFAELETPMSALVQQNTSNRAGFQFDIKTFSINNEKQNTDVEDSPIDYRSPTAFLNDVFGRPITSIFKLGKTDANEQRRKMEKELRQMRTELDVVLISTFIEQSLVLPLRAFSKLLNEEILQIFIRDLDILGHLEALRKYYFLMDGEVAQNICDCLFRELEEKSKNEAFSIPKLQLILKTSFLNCLDGKYSERLSFTVGALPPDHPSTMPQELATLNMCYFVEWPLNLILNPETLMQYSSIFSYLISIRRIRWCLERAHVLLKEKGQYYGDNLLLSPQYKYVLLIRYKFYTFVRALEHHVTSYALESSWQVFRDELQSIASIEDLYRKHVTYIKKIRFLCLRNRKSFEFAVAINNAFKVITKYCRIIMQDEGWIFPRRKKFFLHKKFLRFKNLENEFDQCVKYIVYLGKKVVNRGYQKEVEFFIDLINLNNHYQ